MSEEIQPEPDNEIRQDPDNLNRGTERGIATIEQSILAVGYGRPGVVTEDNVIVAGNHMHKVSQKLGHKPNIIDVDGMSPVFVRIKGLKSNDVRAFQMAVLDNRSNQLNFNPDLVATQVAAQEAGLAPEEIAYTIEELTVSAEPLSADDAKASSEKSPDAGALGNTYGVYTECKDEDEQREVYEMLTAAGKKCVIRNI